MRLSRLKCLDSFSLKLLAMALMLCDHLWATVIPGNGWLTSVGRLAFPVFAFQIAEGFTRTRSVKGYLKRLFLWALVSEVPFDLMYGGSAFYPFHQNVLFTFCLALCLLALLERAREKSRPLFLLLVPVTFAAGYLLGMVTMVDYYGYGVLTVLVFWLAGRLPHAWLFQLAGLWVINVVMMGGMILPVELFGLSLEIPQQGLALLALAPIWLYNGKRGKISPALQTACYAFYPAHMAVLVLLRRLLL